MTASGISTATTNSPSTQHSSSPSSTLLPQPLDDVNQDSTSCTPEDTDFSQPAYRSPNSDFMNELFSGLPQSICPQLAFDPSEFYSDHTPYDHNRSQFSDDDLPQFVGYEENNFPSESTNCPSFPSFQGWYLNFLILESLGEERRGDVGVSWGTTLRCCLQRVAKHIHSCNSTSRTRRWSASNMQCNTATVICVTMTVATLRLCLSSRQHHPSFLARALAYVKVQVSQLTPQE